MNLIFHLGIWVASWLACNQLDAMEVIPADLQDSVGESWSFSKAFFWSCWHCMRRALRQSPTCCLLAGSPFLILWLLASKPLFYHSPAPMFLPSSPPPFHPPGFSYSCAVPCHVGNRKDERKGPNVKSDCPKEGGRVCWELYYMVTFPLLTRLGAKWDYFNFSDEETEAQKSELTCWSSPSR